MVTINALQQRRMEANLRSLRITVLIVALVWSVLAHGQAAATVQLSLDTSEAEQALVILTKGQSNVPISAADWEKLFSTVPYQWLKARETAMGVPFTDKSFKPFFYRHKPLAREQWQKALDAMEAFQYDGIGGCCAGMAPCGSENYRSRLPRD